VAQILRARGVNGRALRLALVGALSVLLLETPAQAQDILDCRDFDSQEEAQERLREDPDDPHGLDGPPGQPSTGRPGLACEELPPPRDERVVPYQSQGGSPEGEPPDREPPEREPPDREPPDKDEKLLEAGGDLPLPQQANTDNPSGDQERFPLWRIAGMILSAGVFTFAGYLVVSSRR
jgi:hypothetical protein